MRFNPQKLTPRYSYGIRKVQLRYRGITHRYSYGIGNALQRYSYGIYGLLQRYSYGTPSIYTKGIGLRDTSSGYLVSANRLNIYQTPSASNNIALAVIDTKGGKVRATNQSDRYSITPLTALVCSNQPECL